MVFSLSSLSRLDEIFACVDNVLLVGCFFFLYNACVYIFMTVRFLCNGLVQFQVYARMYYTMVEMKQTLKKKLNAVRFPYVCLEHLTLAKRTLTSSQATRGLISLHKHLPQRKQNYFTTFS